MQECFIAGAGMTRIARHGDRGLKSLTAEAVEAALADAGLQKSQLEVAYCGSVAAGVLWGQVQIPGEHVLRSMGIDRIPVINVENACATSATAFQQAVQAIAFGVHDVALVLGYEKLHAPDKAKVFAVFQGAIDVEGKDDVVAQLVAETGADPADFQGATAKRSIFMDIYAATAKAHMARYGSTPRHFAMIAEKNAFHGSLNPNAQYRATQTVDEVLAAPMISDPLTLPMCCPTGDGAGALVLVSDGFARRAGLSRLVRVRASILASGFDDLSADTPASYAARLAYEKAGVSPQEVDVVELHDATAPAELAYYEHLGLAAYGDGVALLESGSTRLGGRCPVNPSGGLLRKGHPIGATGAIQIHELVQQLRGEAGARQSEGARIGLAENGGGYIGRDVGAIVISILEGV